MSIYSQNQCWKISLFINNLFFPFDIILLCLIILSFLNNLNSCLLTHCFHPPMWILNYWSILGHQDSLADKWDKLDTDEQFANWHEEYSFKIAQRMTNSSQNQTVFLAAGLKAQTSHSQTSCERPESWDTTRQTGWRT